MEKDIVVGADVNQIKMTSLSQIIGQPQVTYTLAAHIQGYFNIRSTLGDSNIPFGPVMLCGPPGTGKTTVAKLLHNELGNLRFIETNGETINDKSELYSIIINADSNTTILIDEAQAIKAKTQHILLTAISERIIYEVIPKPS